MAQRTPEKTTRNKKVYEEYLAGKSTYALAAKYDVKQPRIVEIIKQARKKIEFKDQQLSAA